MMARKFVKKSMSDYHEQTHLHSYRKESRKLEEVHGGTLAVNSCHVSKEKFDMPQL